VPWPAIYYQRRDVAVVNDPETNLKLIIKDGNVYKNTL